jgi:hypothetical protein
VRLEPTIARLTGKLPSTIKLGADLTINAAAPDKAGPRTFTLDPAYSGGVVRLSDFPLPLVIDLAGLSKAKRITANLDHDRKQRVGHVSDVTNDGRSLKMAGVLSGASTATTQVIEASDAGYPWGCSIEVAVAKLVEVAAGKTASANGQTFDGPLLIARKGTLLGVALSDSPADQSTAVTIAATAPPSAQRRSLKMDFTEWLANLGLSADDLSAEQIAKLQDKHDAEQKAAKLTGGPQSLDDVLTARRNEEQRQSQIAQLTDQALSDYPGKATEIEAIARLAIDQRWPATKFELEVLRAGRPSAGTFRPGSRGNHPDAKVLTAALCLSAGMPDVEKHFSADVLQLVDDHKLRQIGIQQVLIQAAHANGYPARPGERILQGNLESILQYAFPPATARLSGFSNVNLPSLLGNVANKEIVSGFMEEDQTWREVGVVKPVNNFYKHTVHRLLDDLEYEDLGQGGEIQHGKLSEETYTRQAKTRAIMLGLTREQIINDDMNAFDDLRTRLGRGAGRKLKNIFWATFLNNASFFTAGRGNFISGATTTLLEDGVGLQLGLTAFRKLKSAVEDGAKRIGGQPVMLVVPPELEFAASRLFQSTNVNTGGAATATTVPNANIHGNKYRPVVVVELSDPAFTGNSATAWYLLRDKAILPAVVVSALGGRVEPTVESTNADFHQLGVQFRGYNDVGCDLAEYLCGIKSKGAA